MLATLDSESRQSNSRKKPGTLWPGLAVAAIAAWSLVYLALGIMWLTGGPGNPADPAVDEGATLSLLGSWGPQAGAVMITVLAGLGVLLTAAMTVQPAGSGRTGLNRVRLVHHLLPVMAGTLGVVLAIVLPDYRLLATVAYAPILLVLLVFGAAPEGASLWEWPVLNMAVLSLAGLAWIVAAASYHRKLREVTASVQGKARRGPGWTTPEATARWGRWATAVAVAVPLGYATTRYAWALGIPLGVDQQLLEDLGNGVYAGAGLATLGVGGAMLTLGLVQRWGESFPRWMLGLRGRRVPIGLAVVPAALVSVAVTSAGLMFIRFGISGKFGDTFPGENGDVAAWLPEMFWPLWGVALAAATFAYWLRRRGGDRPVSGYQPEVPGSPLNGPTTSSVIQPP